MRNKYLKIVVLMMIILTGLSSLPIEVSAGSDSFVGEIVLFPYNFVPIGWARCDGQIMQIKDNTALFSLLGTVYGGDGKTTYALPNLNEKAPDGISSNPLGKNPQGVNLGSYCIATQGIFPPRP